MKSRRLGAGGVIGSGSDGSFCESAPFKGAPLDAISGRFEVPYRRLMRRGYLVYDRMRNVTCMLTKIFTEGNDRDACRDDGLSHVLVLSR